MFASFFSYFIVNCNVYDFQCFHKILLFNLNLIFNRISIENLIKRIINVENQEVVRTDVLWSSFYQWKIDSEFIKESMVKIKCPAVFSVTDVDITFAVVTLPKLPCAFLWIGARALWEWNAWTFIRSRKTMEHEGGKKREGAFVTSFARSEELPAATAQLSEIAHVGRERRETLQCKSSCHDLDCSRCRLWW